MFMKLPYTKQVTSLRTSFLFDTLNRDLKLTKTALILSNKFFQF